MEAPDPANVRIVTTLGHVDHGKTTLMDALLAANNIISPRMAGKMRYLDSREDEQERGITMESSAVSLKFQVAERSPDGEKVTKTYVVNMVDTPGHVDFSSEVSTASRLCDGALVLVDVVEGVCTQTIAVLRQAWQDRLSPILVINKFDRLITELKLAPIEAYHHLVRLIEQVNAVMGSFFASDRMEDDLRWHEDRARRLAARKELYATKADTMAEAEINDADEFKEKDDEDIYFAPEKGNVVFASALRWLYAAKMGMKEANLRKVIWGDFFLDPKTKKIISYKHLRGRALKPLFVQFVLDNLWAVYDAVVIDPNPEKVTKIVNALSLKIPPRDLKSKDSRHLLQLICKQWLSLSTCIIQAAIDIVPAPPVAQGTRIPKMLYPELREETLPPKNKLEADLYGSKSESGAYVAAYVSKMFAVPAKDLPENKKRPPRADEMRARGRDARIAKLQDETNSGSATPFSSPSPVPPASRDENAASGTNTPNHEAENGENEVILGFARIYSGTIRVGSEIYAVLPKYNAALGPKHRNNEKYLIQAQVEGLYTMMGRELVGVGEVKAGNIFAIKGLASKVWRSATLCASSEEGVNEENMKEWLINLGGINRRVAADMPKLINGLKLLSQSDPCVETFQQQTGEHVILTAGELHLERCLKDLRERFARVEIQPSAPIVPFRETAIKAADMAPTKTPNVPRGTIRGASSNSVVKFSIRAVPLPRVVLDFLLDNILTLKKIQQERKAKETDKSAEHTHEPEDDDVELDISGPEQFWNVLQEKCREAGSEWVGQVDRIWAFGPHRAGGCVLIDARRDVIPNSLKHRLNGARTEEIRHASEAERFTHSFDHQIETGFQLATFQGPLCAEPVEGLAYFVESVVVDKECLETQKEENKTAQVAGSLISAVRDACRNGLLDWSPRLMLAMYTCDIQASTDVLGRMYAVIAKRRGRIVAEEMKEGTSFFNVTALLPVVESFGFADDIRKRTSGAASPQLLFSGYELLDQDPFWVPTTEEELEDLGEKADRSNIAKGYMDAVRGRKGMFVDRKIVEFAEKQRTLKR
ncbi:translation elongation factor 2 [Amanita rubescens]|nr:translation elongation factor 2 [Amanita rubescens]